MSGMWNPLAASRSAKFVPCNGGGDRSAGTRAHGIGGDGGGAAFVAQPVDEDPALALGLRHGGDVVVRIGVGYLG